MPARSTTSIAVLLTLALAACPGEGFFPEDPSGSAPTDSMPGDTMMASVSFAADVQPIFTANCALSGCHAGATPQQGMNLSAGQAYAAIVNVPSMEVPALMRVRPGQPDSSYLVRKIEGTASVGARMPFGRTPLDSATIATIRTWIAEGADDN